MDGNFIKSHAKLIFPVPQVRRVFLCDVYDHVVIRLQPSVSLPSSLERPAISHACS